MSTSSTSTEAMWSERVRSWRSSGESASAFARNQGFAHSALRYWAGRLKRSPKRASLPTLLPLVRTSRVTVVSTDVRPAAPASDIVVEIGAARIRVSRGFEPEVLTAVVRALSGDR